MAAEGSRGASGTGADFNIRAVARLSGFPAIFFPIGSDVPPGIASGPGAALHDDDNIENYIVNNFQRG
jgi:hypothetical protein